MIYVGLISLNDTMMRKPGILFYVLLIIVSLGMTGCRTQKAVYYDIDDEAEAAERWNEEMYQEEMEDYYFDYMGY